MAKIEKPLQSAVKDLFPVRKRVMEGTPFGGDPVLEALAREAFIQRRTRRRQQGFARGGRFTMAATGVPLERREFLAPIDLPGISHEQAAQANAQIHDRIKALEEYLSSPGADAQKAQKELLDLYKTILTQASTNARQISSNVTSAALKRADLRHGLAKEFEELIGSPEKSDLATREGPKGEDYVKFIQDLNDLDANDKKEGIRQIILSFGVKYPDDLDTVIKDVYQKIEGPIRDTTVGDPVDIDSIIAQARQDLEVIKAAIDKDPQAKKAMDQARKINDVVEAALLDELQTPSSIQERNNRLAVELKKLRGGGVALSPEVEKMIGALDSLMLKYGNVTSPEQLLRAEQETRPEIQDMYNAAVDSLVEPTGLSDYHLARDELIKSESFKKFMKDNPELSQERAVRLLLRQAKQGKTLGQVAQAPDTPQPQQGLVRADDIAEAAESAVKEARGAPSKKKLESVQSAAKSQITQALAPRKTPTTTTPTPSSLQEPSSLELLGRGLQYIDQQSYPKEDVPKQTSIDEQIKESKERVVPQNEPGRYWMTR